MINNKIAKCIYILIFICFVSFINIVEVKAASKYTCLYYDNNNNETFQFEVENNLLNYNSTYLLGNYQGYLVEYEELSNFTNINQCPSVIYYSCDEDTLSCRVDTSSLGNSTSKWTLNKSTSNDYKHIATYISHTDQSEIRIIRYTENGITSIKGVTNQKEFNIQSGLYSLNSDDYTTYPRYILRDNEKYLFSNEQITTGYDDIYILSQYYSIDVVGFECSYGNNEVVFKFNKSGTLPEYSGMFGSFSNYKYSFSYPGSDSVMANFGALKECPDVIYYSCYDNSSTCYVFANAGDQMTYGQKASKSGSWPLYENREYDNEGNSQTSNSKRLATYVNVVSGVKIYVDLVKDSVLGTHHKIYSDFDTYPNNNLDKNVFTENSSYANYPKYIKTDPNNNLTFEDNVTTLDSSIFVLDKYAYGLQGMGGKEIEQTCEGIFGESFIRFLKNNVFRIIYIAVPIILLVMTTLDFAKVVFIDDKEGIQKASKKFGKRCIAAVLIYFTPSILILIINILGVDEVEKCIQTFKNIQVDYVESN